MNLTTRPKNFQYMAVIAIIVGMILVVYPTVALSVVIITIGCLLILSSVSSFIDYYKLKSRSLHPSNTMLLNGIVSGVVGTILVMSPLFFVSFLLTLLSILLLLGSLTQIVTLLYSRNKGMSISLYLYIVPSLLLILAIIMLTTPITSASTITSMFGYGIIVYSIMELITYYVIKKIDKN